MSDHNYRICSAILIRHNIMIVKFLLLPSTTQQPFYSIYKTDNKKRVCGSCTYVHTYSLVSLHAG